MPDDAKQPADHASSRARIADAAPVHADPHDDLGFALPEPAKPGGGRVTLVIILVAAGLAAAFFLGYLPRRENSAALARGSQSAALTVPSVNVVQPKPTQSTRPLSLPASLQPLADTVLYPRANGYVAHFDVDIGQQVKEGQLLAVIETPEIDQQLDQARAQLLQTQAALGQAEAQRNYANISLQRYQRLRPAGVASQQELDQKQAESQVSEANVTAAAATVEVTRADVRRLTQIKSFARVVAPFSGIITSRTTERGALVAAGNSTPLFRIADIDTMRAFVQVPQDLAVHMQIGAKAAISVREFPGRSFEGILTRTAGALDAATRTMTTEIRIDNRKHELLAGMYADATLAIEQARTLFELPATALWNDGQGLRVAVVDAQDSVHFRTITIDRDAGSTILIASGLVGNERVVKLANAGLIEGSKVRVRAP
jgi:membrane fusion protein, multidrug efflux system